jgi:tetratricopeptide (TPR) repeat protein
VEIAEDALRRFPEDDELHALHGDALAYDGQQDEARREWMRWRHIVEGDTHGFDRLRRDMLAVARREASGRHWERAERFYRRAAVLDPSSAEACVGVAEALVQQRLPQLSLPWSRRAVEVDPASSTAHVGLGDVLQRIGETESALVEWRAARDLDPSNYEARHRLDQAEQ